MLEKLLFSFETSTLPFSKSTVASSPSTSVVQVLIERAYVDSLVLEQVLLW